jgi:elongation factor Ts
MIEKIKELREKTQAPLSACREALMKAGGDLEKAKEILEKEFLVFKDKEEKKERNQAGIVDAYIHSNRKIGVILHLECQTDFVAKNEIFKNLAHELCLQIASMAPKNVEDLFSQPWIKDATKTISQIINETSAKLGEKISVVKFERYEI